VQTSYFDPADAVTRELQARAAQREARRALRQKRVEALLEATP